MQTNFASTEETLGYVTHEDSTNTSPKYLIGGSKNVLIDTNRKVGIRNGYTRLGAGSATETPIRNAFTWNTSTGDERPLRFYDDEWEVYLTTVDATVINAWTRFSSGRSATATPRGAIFFDTVENIDEMIFVEGTDDLIEWNGAVSVIASKGTGTLTKAGTTTWAQNRAYTSANKIFTNVRTGVDFTYTGGESTLTLTSVTPDPAGEDVIAGDIMVQKIVTATNKPGADRNNHTIFSFENQVVVGSEDDDEVFISQNDDYADFSFSAPRISGEGGILTLDGPSRGFGAIGSFLIAFAGQSGIFRADYQQITVSTTLAETLKVKKLDVGVNQGSLTPDCVIPIGNALAYLSNEVALRIIQNPQDIDGLDPRTFSNPIKPDFDAEIWDGASGIWFKNAIWISAKTDGRVYSLQFVEDADGKVRRYWQPPQTLPIGPFSIIDGGLYGHSSSVPESYLIYNPERYSDLIANGSNGEPGDKTPINAIAVFAYQNFGKAGILKNFDEFYVEGEINQNTSDLSLTLKYDFNGSTQSIVETIDGTDEDLLEGTVQGNSLAQASLGVNPLGGLLNPPSDARKFRVVFEEAKEDFYEINDTYETNEIDRYWAIIRRGPNVVQSTRRDSFIRR